MKTISHLPGVSEDNLSNVDHRYGVDGVVYNVDDAVARLNVRLLHLRAVDSDRFLQQDLRSSHFFYSGIQ